MTSAKYTATLDAIRVWRKAYFAGYRPALGYESENIIHKMMRGTALIRGKYTDSEIHSAVDQVTEAVKKMRQAHSDGDIKHNLADPFIAHYLHLIRGEKAVRNGNPMPPAAKAQILGVSRRTYYRRLEDAIEFINDCLQKTLFSGTQGDTID